MPIDPRTLEVVKIGTPLRDAAVDPDADDFLPPTNAGVDNPHGETVVSPGVHALQGNRPVRPGLVSDDPAVQSADETEHLGTWQPATVPPEPEPDPGP